MKLDVKTASIDALDAVKGKTGRICPLICEQGFKADGDRCSKINCRAGFEVGDDNTCEKIEIKRPTSKRQEPKATGDQKNRATLDAAPAKPPASGQTGTGQKYICGQGGCREVGKGCRVVVQQRAVNGTYSAQVEVCN